jgi:L-ascorbate metabolism protein UlaG (beta-lactamase superfamily)/N-acetylneuraminic acid mutarotase
MKSFNGTKISNSICILISLMLSGLLGRTGTSLAADDTWTYKADIPTARTWVGGCVLDGKIYVIGGGRSDSSATSVVEVYDPLVNTWTKMANMPSARCYPVVCTFNGKIYVFGGSSGVWSSAFKSVFLYDPQTGVWTQKADMPYAIGASGIAVVENMIYLMGGAPSASAPGVSTVMAYDPIAESWTRKADMPTARVCLSACALDGKIYAIGGYKDDWQTFAYKLVEVYDPSTNTWIRKQDMPTARWSPAACVVDGKIYVTGGNLYMQALTVNEVYDPATDTWTTKAPMQQKRLGHFLGSIGGKIYAIGGHYPWLITVSKTEEYDSGLTVVPSPDFNSDGIVDFGDFAMLAQYWFQDESSVDIAPLPLGDGLVNFKDLAVLSEHWLETETVYIQWLGHASVKIWTDDAVIYVDPRNLSGSPHDATLVLVTHSHSDHYSAADISKVWGPDTNLIASADVIASQGRGQALMPGQTTEADGVGVTGVAAYNTNKPNHPKANNWLGFIIEIGSKRIYCAGDTDLIPEMQTLGNIDVAFLPAGGTYTMNATEAAQAATIINPTLAIPYHWGTSVGTLADAQLFARLAGCNAKVMTAGETLSSQDWEKEFSLMAHWKLDETAGTTANDSADSKDGALNGNPIWLPAGGKIDGALQFDGADDHVSAPFVVNPADGPFSVFAWIKDGMPGQVIISQIGGANWLSADSPEGKLMTDLSAPAGRFPPQPLTSQSVITDGDWHRVGLVWDGTSRILYVDDVEVAKDTQPGLAGSTGGLYIGAGKNLEAGSFPLGDASRHWSGLIDDVRIYGRAIVP